ncbi:uncharacterized protein LOC103474038 [Poecilia reticulata]|uniref:uncharacterized protein LOC103474038 n=1 Tax=Poecilia reticulata TaxID=8081 RepID=UPI0004A44909|nr:PREDICTED: uncharacterized protein LOC103474038 [Poecilia reticulata]
MAIICSRRAKLGEMSEKRSANSNLEDKPGVNLYKPHFDFLPGTTQLRLQASSEATAAAQQVVVGPDGTPGYQHVVHLSRRLVELCRKGYVNNAEVEEIVGVCSVPIPLQGLTDEGEVQEKQDLRSWQRSPAGGGEHETLRGGNGERSRLQPPGGGGDEAAVRHVPGQQEGGGDVAQPVDLVLRDYNTIRSVVVSHPALKTRTSLQLFAINQATLSQWHKKWTAANERTILMAAVPPLQAPREAAESLLPAKELQRPQPPPSTSLVFQNICPLEPRDETGASQPPAGSRPSTPAPSTSSSSLEAPGPLPAGSITPKSTVWNRKKLLRLQEAAAKEGATLKVRAPSINVCSGCGLC